MVRQYLGFFLRLILVISISLILVGLTSNIVFGEDTLPNEHFPASCTLVLETEIQPVKALLNDLTQAFLARDFDRIASLSCPWKRDRYRKLFKKYREEPGMIELGESLKTALPSSVNKPINEADEKAAVVSITVKNKKKFIELIKIDGKWLVSDFIPEINAREKDGVTQLHHAAFHGQIDTLKNLLEFGANIEEKDTMFGQTPFEFAIYNNELIAAKLLVEAGADTSAIDFDKNRTQNGFWISPLHWAVLLGQLENAKTLIENGTDINVKNSLGATPLQWAAQMGASETITFLVRKGADVNDKNLLSLAIKCDSPDSVDCLIQVGVDPNEKSSDKSTPLHLATERNRLDIASLLIKNGADVNAENEYGESPLHFAAYRNNLEIAKCLIEQGARVDTKDKEGSTPLDSAVVKGSACLELVKLLFERSISNNSKKELAQLWLPKALYSHRLDLVKYFIEQGANLNSLDDPSGIFSFWIRAALDSNQEALSYILEKGYNVNMKDRNGNTIFHFPGFRNREIAKFLIFNGADVNLKNKFHNTPLHCAVDICNLKGVKFILELGADFQVKNKDGLTPLQMAEQQLLLDQYSTRLEELKAIIELLNNALANP